jgi:hypothetical protein
MNVVTMIKKRHKSYLAIILSFKIVKTRNKYTGEKYQGANIPLMRLIIWSQTGQIPRTSLLLYYPFIRNNAVLFISILIIRSKYRISFFQEGNIFSKYIEY